MASIAVPDAKGLSGSSRSGGTAAVATSTTTAAAAAADSADSAATEVWSLPTPNSFAAKAGFRDLNAPGADDMERVVLASYPRSGNSMARRLLEEMTGIFTGSDTRPKRAMAEMLRDYGLAGESVTNRSVWAIKSHFPERYGWRKFRVQRAILLVRHPINAIDSYFNMQLSASHTLSLCESEFERFASVWQDHIEMETRVWKRFHEYWLSRKIPILIVR